MFIYSEQTSSVNLSAEYSNHLFLKDGQSGLFPLP